MTDRTMEFQDAFRGALMHQLSVGASIGVSAREQARVDFDHDHLARSLIVRLKTRVLAHQLPTEVVEELQPYDVESVHFRTWWDHYKASYRGRWWMRWRAWDVQYRVETRRITAKLTVNLERFHAFPDANVRIEGLGDPVYVMRAPVASRRWIDEGVRSYDDHQ